MEMGVEMGFWGLVLVIVNKYGFMFLQGAGVTLLIALTGTVIGSAIGLLAGVLRTILVSPKDNLFKKIVLKAVNFLLVSYIEVFRGTPMIVQAIVIYYGLMEGFGIDIPPLNAAILVVSINTGAYMAEIVRGGIDSIDKGQFEASHAIGMSHWQTMRRIIIPQTIRNILPATSNEFIINIKDTSVLNVISVTELFFMSKSVRGITYRTFEVYMVTCVIYFALTFSISQLLRYVERRLDGPSSYSIHGSSTMPGSEFVFKGGRKL